MTVVSIMRFRAGPSACAVAAGCVEGVGPVRAGVPHLARLFDQTASAVEGLRTLQLASRGRRIEVTVDGPVDVVEVARKDITPCRTPVASKVLGFACFDGELYALLDIERLIDLMNLPPPPLVSPPAP